MGGSTESYIRNLYEAGEIPELGKQYRFEHENCAAGDDSRKHRLYIFRDPSTPYNCLFKCHHCGESGRIQLVGRPSDEDILIPSISDDKTKSSTAPQPDPYLTELDNVEFDPGNWPDAAWSYFRRHLCGGSIRQFSIHDHWLGYHWPRQSIVYNNRNNFLQLRALYPSGPKYLTIRSDTMEHQHCLIGGLALSGETIVIVEDMISACKVSTAGHIAACLFGSSPSLETLFKICHHRETSKFVVWLDNDNPTVTHSSFVIGDRLSMLGCTEVKRVTALQDPKHYTIAEIKLTVSI